MSVETYAGPKELIAEARKRGLWLHCAYQDLWFSPDELEAANREGKFRWGPGNWKLRDPQEQLAAAERQATKARIEADRIRSRLPPALAAEHGYTNLVFKYSRKP